MKSGGAGRTKADTVTRVADQRERLLIETDLDRNVLVEAAAGTGKTTCMLARMVALLRTGKCDSIRKLAAVTFTRKAASELRARFQVQLEKAVTETERKERENLRRALAGLEQCFIGTIHSFCGRLLRERPVEAGVNLAFEEIDEDVDQRLRKDAWAEYSTRLVAHDPSGVLENLETLGLKLQDLENGFSRFADFPDVGEWPLPAREEIAADLKKAVREVRRYAEHMRRLGPRLPADPGTDKLIADYRRLPRIISHYENLSRPAHLMEVLRRFDRGPGLVQKHWMKDGAFTREEAKGEEERWNQFRAEIAKPMLRRWCEFRYGPVMGIFQEAREVYDGLRHRSGLLNYQDLLIKAAGLLRDKPHVREYFRERYPFLLVDEFQDTDPVQAEVMLLLAAADPAETDWRHCRPRPGSLFVVGDPKQSIYRFRRADIIIYNEVKEIIGREGLVLQLSTNFRTSPCVIDWVNQVFAPAGVDPAAAARAMPRGAPGVNLTEQGASGDSPGCLPSGNADGGPMLRFPATSSMESPSYVALQPGREEGLTGELAGVHTLRIPAEYANKESIAEYEPDRVARTIRCALDSGITISRTRQQLEEGVAARATPADFLIVTWKKEWLSIYGRALQKYGIPHQVTGGTALEESNELKLLISCLKVVDRPDDQVALVGALRSELMGFSDAELYAFKKAGGRFSYTAPVPEAFGEGYGEKEREAFRDAFGRFRKYHSWLARMPVLAAVEKIVADLGLMALSASRPGGETEAGGLAKALELLRAAERATWSASEVVERLAELVEPGESCDGLSVRSEEKPVVRVMNLHKVKGLEAPVVFLADPYGDYDHAPDLHIERSGRQVRGFMAVCGPGKGFKPGPLLAQPASWEELSEREKRFGSAETLRLRYVAATRAGSALIVTQRDGKSTSPWKYFADFLSAVPEIADPGPQSAPAVVQTRLVPEEPQLEAERIAAALSALANPTYNVFGVKEYAQELGYGAAAEEEKRQSERHAGMADQVAAAAESPVHPCRSAKGKDSLVAPLEPAGREKAEAPSPPSPTGVEAGSQPGSMLETAGGEHGMEWGTVIHLLLETAMGNPEAGLVDLARSALGEQGLDVRLAPEAVNLVRSVLSSTLWQRALRSRQRFTEIPFEILEESTASADDSKPPVLLRGQIDLVFQEDDGWVLLDFKTDLRPVGASRALLQTYLNQIRLYALAWERSTGEKVKEAALYFVREDRLVYVLGPGPAAV